jgi:DNA recombination protein RmuC
LCQEAHPGLIRALLASNHLLVASFFIALVAAVLAGLITWLILQGRRAALTERLSSREEENTRLNSEVLALRDEVARLSSLKTKLETELAAARDSQVQQANAFNALAAEALSRNNTSFLELARESFAKLQQASAGDLDKRQLAIDALVKPLRESLQQVDTKIAAIENARKEAYGSLTEQLRSLNTAQLQLQTEASKLSTALRSTTTAGTWGELQLRRVVEMAGMESYCDFGEQQSAGGLRADLVVRLPGGHQIVIDAKTPLDAYREAANAPDETVRAAKLMEHAVKVRGHIDALGAKNYWEQFQPSPEYVVLFLPGDQFLSGALQADPTLIDRAIARRILLTTPASLIALLKAAAYGWRQEAVSKNAEAIAALGRELHDRVSNFAEHLDNIGSGLKSALGNYNKAVGSYEGALLPGARKLAELGAKGAKELPSPAPLEIAPREVTKRS